MNVPSLRLPKITVRLVLVAASVVAVAAAAVLAHTAGAQQPTPPQARPAQSAASTTAAEAGTPPPPSSVAPASPATPEGSSSATGEADHGEDGVTDDAPGFDAGPPNPAEAAAAFLARYMNTQGKTPERWQADLAGMVAPRSELAALLPTVDLAKVPGGRIGSPVTFTLIGNALADVTLPLTTNAGQPNGTAVVTMTGESGRWLATAVDTP